MVSDDPSSAHARPAGLIDTTAAHTESAQIEQN
jgi:hypothetical protein